MVGVVSLRRLWKFLIISLTKIKHCVIYRIWNFGKHINMVNPKTKAASTRVNRSGQVARVLWVNLVENLGGPDLFIPCTQGWAWPIGMRHMYAGSCGPPWYSCWVTWRTGDYNAFAAGKEDPLHVYADFSLQLTRN